MSMATDSIDLKDKLVEEFVESNFGKKGYLILLALEKKGRTDEWISKKVNLKVNEIRAFLNQLHYAGIIYYTKEKAKDSNWYTYTWFVKKERIGELLEERYVEELEELKKKLDFESTYTFFKCSKGCTKLPFELAFEYDFKCPECGAVMKSFSNEKEKKRLKEKINEIEKFLNKQKEIKQTNAEKIKEKRLKELGKVKFEKEKLKKIKEVKTRTSKRKRVKKKAVEKKEIGKKGAKKAFAKKKRVKKKITKSASRKRKKVKKK